MFKVHKIAKKKTKNLSVLDFLILEEIASINWFSAIHNYTITNLAIMHFERGDSNIFFFLLQLGISTEAVILLGVGPPTLLRIYIKKRHKGTYIPDYELNFRRSQTHPPHAYITVSIHGFWILC